MKTINIVCKLLLLSFAIFLHTAINAEIKVTYYIPDASGSPVAATDEQGKVLWRAHRMPFGTEVNKDPASSNNHIGFTGHVHDSSTGLTYMGARYYDPIVGRFMGMDSAGVDPEDPRTFNRFAYANNSPYKYVDPDGRDAVLPPNAWPQVSREAPQAWNAIKEGTKGGLTAISFFAGGGAGLVGRTAVAAKTGKSIQGLKSVQNRLNFKGDPNSVIRGSDVARKGGGKRAFITDKNGKIIKEITPQRVKERVSNTLPDGTVRETFKKTGGPSDADLKILDGL